MFYYFFSGYPNVMMGVGALCAFLLTAIGLYKFKDRLPADEGREFAVDGKLSRGKPRGGGLIFILCFAIAEVLFAPPSMEYLIYTGLIVAEMLTGFLDDASSIPWGRYKKGMLDLIVALIIAYTYVHYNGCDMIIGFLNVTVTMNRWVLYALAAFMVFVSINVTNCADGVDGLSGTLVLVTILSFIAVDIYNNPVFSGGYGNLGRFTYPSLFFVSSILAYLWYNAPPSSLLMGDAGSRAMGVFIAIIALKSKLPLLYFIFAAMLILDGGLGLVKIMIIKIFKKNPLARIRTPLHDHVRKNVSRPWSNEQVDMRFAIIQGVTSIVYVFLFLR
mgnify:CR=1 FL=1